jgi:hypothetical protein
MSSETILSLIDAEIARLTEVRSLLATAGKVSTKAVVRKAVKAIAKTTKKKRVLSPEARKRIAEAQRKRWAAQKAKA